MTELGKRLESAGSQVTLTALRLQPFWNQIGYVDCAPLLDETVRWLAARLPLRLPTP